MKLREGPVNRIVSWLGALLIVFGIGLGARAVPAQGQEDEQALRAQEQQLSRKVHSLKAEQRQLLLRKALYSADSKYLELDLRSGEGSLKYRTRVLRSFRFTRRGTGPDRGMSGEILSLTSKEDGTSAKRRLLFDKAALVIEGKTHRGAHNGKSLFISISRRDLAAIYYALEAGSFACLKE
jgi:hypothetical protein